METTTSSQGNWKDEKGTEYWSCGHCGQECSSHPDASQPADFCNNQDCRCGRIVCWDCRNGGEKAYINGTVYVVTGTVPASTNEPSVRRWVSVRRPKGRKVYAAKDYGPHPVHGENSRYVIVCSIG